MDDGLTQRWRGGTHAWRHRSEGGFDRSKYDVVVLPDDRTPKAFVETHHYSGSFPAARLRYGLYRGAHLEGVAVLGVPPRARVLTRPFPGLAPYAVMWTLGGPDGRALSGLPGIVGAAVVESARKSPGDGCISAPPNRMPYRVGQDAPAASSRSWLSSRGAVTIASCAASISW